MPLYEYLCDSCGHRFERIQKFSDPPVTDCPSCGGKVQKQISSPAIQFKGSGWYITDYAKSGKSDSATKPASSSGDAANSAPAADKAEKSAGAADSAPAKPAAPSSDKK